MEYYELIENRESIRNYDPDKKVPENVLKRILNAGRLARRQPTDSRGPFIWFRRKTRLKRG